MFSSSLRIWKMIKYRDKTMIFWEISSQLLGQLSFIEHRRRNLWSFLYQWSRCLYISSNNIRDIIGANNTHLYIVWFTFSENMIIQKLCSHKRMEARVNSRHRCLSNFLTCTIDYSRISTAYWIFFMNRERCSSSCCQSPCVCISISSSEFEEHFFSRTHTKCPRNQEMMLVANSFSNSADIISHP